MIPFLHSNHTEPVAPHPCGAPKLCTLIKANHWAARPIRRDVYNGMTQKGWGFLLMHAGSSLRIRRRKAAGASVI